MGKKSKKIKNKNNPEYYDENGFFEDGYFPTRRNQSINNDFDNNYYDQNHQNNVSQNNPDFDEYSSRRKRKQKDYDTEYLNRDNFDFEDSYRNNDTRSVDFDDPNNYPRSSRKRKRQQELFDDYENDYRNNDTRNLNDSKPRKKTKKNQQEYFDNYYDDNYRNDDTRSLDFDDPNNNSRSSRKRKRQQEFFDDYENDYRNNGTRNLNDNKPRKKLKKNQQEYFDNYYDDNYRNDDTRSVDFDDPNNYPKNSRKRRRQQKSFDNYDYKNYDDEFTRNVYSNNSRMNEEEFTRNYSELNRNPKYIDDYETNNGYDNQYFEKTSKFDENYYENESRRNKRRGFFGFSRKEKKQSSYDSYDDYQSRRDDDYNYYAYEKNSYSDINGYPLNVNGISNKEDKKKKSIFWSLIGLLCLAVLGGICALTIYYSIGNRTGASSTSKISSEYMKSSDTVSVNAMQYIYQRTLSLQFYFGSNDSSPSKIVSGTGWIFNKEQGTSNYYIATNIHVAATLSYSNKYISSTEDFSNYTLEYVNVGFVDNQDFTSTSDASVHDSKNINIVRVNTLPTITYLADTKTASSFSTGYQGVLNDSQFSGVIDFAILRFDFSPSNLSQPNLISNLSTVTEFQNWLKYYDATPTQFYNVPISDLDNSSNDFYLRKYYMGGFPNNDNTTISDNLGRVEWIGLSNFPIATSEAGTNSYLSASSYYKYASGIYQYNSGEGNKQASEIPYFDSGATTPVEYLNVGLNALLDATSIAGASGSMLVFNDGSNTAPNFKVIGIYWGTQSFQLGLDQVKQVGVASLLNISPYSYEGVTYSGYDIFDDATKAIESSLSTTSSLVYQYNSTNSLITTSSLKLDNVSSFLFNILNFNNSYDYSFANLKLVK